MLVVEHQSNGKRVVKLHKDWHPSRLGSGYIPRPKNYVNSDEMRFVQAALLRRSKK